ncbi:hypothetical protein [Desulfoscipio gibsoniae]|uniref:Uncharacterized protein n=1 Tax=Desulfoscipio gibsoniae DSM 7213 TaxID=767817 RepID=R4KL13_9FIRM|nr:hypothetical protein [Desulfoscipio gibsoniae]AGL03349.1 hypothetical protein Desgi_4090 [Desulfoscipio gibsoniae DSM 7213]
MQTNAALGQTHGRPVAITGHKAGLAAELVIDLANELGTDIKADLAVNSNACGQQRLQFNLVDKVMYALEKEETLTERAVGYGVCILAVLYLLGNLARAVF